MTDTADFDKDFEFFAAHARAFGSEHARDMLIHFGRSPEYIERIFSEFERRLQNAQTGYPPHIFSRPGHQPWYTPLERDQYWPGLRDRLKASKAIPSDQIDKLDESTTKIIAFTNNPKDSSWRTRGLVVGYVQSGKTTNFTAVIAKAVDAGYNLVIVLSGIHNGLRAQTQGRLEAQLLQHHPRWPQMTEVGRDFQTPTFTLESQLPTGDDRKAVLLVVKKNATVLTKVVAWLKGSKAGLRNVKALVIDDEADQATIATPRINPLIRDLLGALPRCTFIGYTATPFANVLADDELYPSDFILNMPKPDRYFGTEMIFGRDDADDGTGPVDGYDMVRIVPDKEAASLRPQRAARGNSQPTFTPKISGSLRDAILWFWLATAAKRARGLDGHSTMLIHTSMKTAVHEAFKKPIEDMQQTTFTKLRVRDHDLEAELKKLWDDETGKVPVTTFPDINLIPVDYSSVRRELEAVVANTTVVLDNSTSADRLDYGGNPVTAIAIGGNTLSRGLTLEGLVVSFFIRSAKAYDTLLQMGRWFGFRIGYEDLPRIYMTAELKKWFRHLAMVEHEVRLDIDRYEAEDQTPRDVAVRIRTHPALLVTQKLGAAKIVDISYGGRRVQSRYFRHRDHLWLDRNLTASRSLIAAIEGEGIKGEPHPEAEGPVVFRNVPVAHILAFLTEYEAHPDSPDLDRAMLLKYLDAQIARNSLNRWSVAVMAAADNSGGTVRLGTAEYGRVTRSRLKDGATDDTDSRADIKTLMSKEHRVVDLAVKPSAARRSTESDLMALRNKDPDLQAQGLLLLYPINPHSVPDDSETVSREPLDAIADVIGLALVFPGVRDHSAIAADLSMVDFGIEIEDPDDIDALIRGDGDDDGDGDGDLLAGSTRVGNVEERGRDGGLED